MRKVKRFEVWIANLDPPFGTEPGKTRPVVVIQTDLLNKAGHPSTLICPMTTNVQPEASLLRIHLRKGDAGLKSDGDILVDQIVAIDNRRFKRKLGMLPPVAQDEITASVKIILDLED